MSALARIARKLGSAVDIVRAALSGKGRVDNIEIFGHQEFRQAVAKALALLRDNEVPAWETLARHVSTILEGRRSTIMVTAHPAYIFIEEAHTGLRSEFLAATIAHMACSCQLHRQYEAEFPNSPVPQDIYAGSVAQARCEQAYRECLRVLGTGGNG